MWRAVPALVLLLAGCEGQLGTMTERRPPPSLVDGGAGRGDAGQRPPPPPPAGDAGEPDPPPSGRDAGSPPPAEDAGPDPGLSAEEQDLLDAINDERASGGLPPVAIDERLLCAARRHALDVGGSGECGHVGSDGSWPWDRAMACGFPQDDWTVNEIAAGPGFTDGADAVWGWRHSDGHYAALMHARAVTVGVGIHNSCFIALFDCCVAGSE